MINNNIHNKKYLKISIPIIFGTKKGSDEKLWADKIGENLAKITLCY